MSLQHRKCPDYATETGPNINYAMKIAKYAVSCSENSTSTPSVHTKCMRTILCTDSCDSNTPCARHCAQICTHPFSVWSIILPILSARRVYWKSTVPPQRSCVDCNDLPGTVAVRSQTRGFLKVKSLDTQRNRIDIIFKSLDAQDATPTYL